MGARDVVDLDVDFPTGHWRAAWVWPYDDQVRSGRRVAAVRTVVELGSAPAGPVVVRVISDAAHVLYVNGLEVGRGPIRANPRRRRHDRLDLAPFLRTGRNVVAAIVSFHGTARPWWMPPPLNTGEVQGGGFSLEAHPDSGVDLRTGTSWTGIVLDGWVDGAPSGGVSGRFVEANDLRSLPEGWNDPGGVEPGWPAVRDLRGHATGEPGDHRGPRSYPFGSLPASPLPAVTPVEVPLVEKDGSWVADRIVVGTVVVDAEGEPGATVKVLTGEFLDDGGNLRRGEHEGSFGVSITTDGTRRLAESLDVYGLAGARVEVDGDAKVHAITVRERLHPVAGDAMFACSDPLLEEIWRVGRRTVSICSLDAYIDCPTREQRAWTGDAVVHQLVDLTTNTDWSLATWTPELAATPRADGMLPMAVAGDAEAYDIAVIPDWALHWIRQVHNLWRWVGDREQVARLLPVAEGVLRWFEPYTRDGLPTDLTGWIIIDWASVTTRGACAPLAGLLGRALVDFAEMAEWLGDAGRASWARGWHDELVTAFEVFWDPDRRLYVDSVVEGERLPPASQHAQAAAIVGGLAPADRHARLVEVLTDRERLVHATWSVPNGEATPNSDLEVGGEYLQSGQPEPWWDAQTQVVAAQPFFRHVVHDALARAGRADLVADLCRDWETALQRCRTSFTETWFGGTVSHGWSSTPTRDLMMRVLGVEPAAPGFVEARIQPALGDLDWARGAVPTPRGLIRIEATAAQVQVDSPVPFVLDGIRHDAGVHTVARA